MSFFSLFSNQWPMHASSAPLPAAASDSPVHASLPIPTLPTPPPDNLPTNNDEWIDDSPQQQQPVPNQKRVIPMWYARARVFYERLYTSIGIPITKITMKDADDHLPFQSGSAFDDWFLSCGSVPFAIERAWTLVDAGSRIVDIALMWSESYTDQFADLCANVHMYMRIEFAPTWRFATPVYGNAAWLELTMTRKTIADQLKWLKRGFVSDNTAFDYILEESKTTTTPSGDTDVIVPSSMKSRVQEAIGTKQLPSSIESLISRYDEPTDSRHARVLAVIHACAVYRLNGRVPAQLTRDTRSLLSKRRVLLEATALDAGTELASILITKTRT